ncbi:MAG TPA: response regulator [Nitrospirota bacterium]|nr:response regulator [Nitrospirota bacterium]
MDISIQAKNQITKKKVLVVDDDEVYLYTTKGILQSDQIEVYTHLNWFGVTNRMKEVQPDLVLLDINMPALAGDKLADLLRRNMDLLHIPIVFHSSNDEESLRNSVVAHRINGYICKGDVNTLKKKVERYLGISVLESATARL